MKIFRKLFGVVLIFLAITTNVYAKENQKTILVLSDRVEQANTKYLIYPQVSEMISADIINELNLSGAIKAPSLSNVRTQLRSSELIRPSQKLLNNYRYTYELNYEALKKIAKTFNTTNVLLITGDLDTASDFIKPTWWNFLNIPGENVVKTEYRLYTYVALVDLNEETIKWQHTYHNQITSPEFALANATYSPDQRQLRKIKTISNKIAKDACYRVESIIDPIFAKEKTPPTLHEKVKFNAKKKQEQYIQNINNKKTPQTKLQPTVLEATTLDSKKIQNTNIKIETKINEQEKSLIIPQSPENTEQKRKEYDIQISPLNIIIPTM